MIAGTLAGGMYEMVLIFVMMITPMTVPGSLEVMIPIKPTNMTSGMIAGVSLPLRSPPAGCLALTGAVTGLIVYAIILYSDNRLTVQNRENK